MKNDYFEWCAVGREFLIYKGGNASIALHASANRSQKVPAAALKVLTSTAANFTTTVFPCVEISLCTQSGLSSSSTLMALQTIWAWSAVGKGTLDEKVYGFSGISNGGISTLVSICIEDILPRN